MDLTGRLDGGASFFVWTSSSEDPTNCEDRRPGIFPTVTRSDLSQITLDLCSADPVGRTSGGANQASTLRCCANRSPTILAEATGLRLQTERQCRHVMRAFWPRLG